MFSLFVQHYLVQPGESLAISLLALDQVNNSREAVWSLEAPNQEVVSVGREGGREGGAQYIIYMYMYVKKPIMVGPDKPVIPGHLF